MLGNVSGTRQVFDRWLKWEPGEEVWNAYIRLEKRYNEYERARDIFRSYTVIHPYPRTWIKWAKYEEEYGTSDVVREVFQTAIESLGDEFVDEKLFVSYARFEAKLKEYERARAIYKFGLDNLPRARSMLLHKEYTTFEKQFGDREGIEDTVVSKRRRQYEEQVKENPKNYDVWFDWARLEETTDDADRVRDVYERAVAQVPPAPEKRLWRRYIFLWLFYALWEETDAKNAERARQIYDTCLGLIPHKQFTFAKVWLQKAYFEVRQGQLGAARKNLGRAIGMAPKEKLFKGYIELEKKLFEFQRCRMLYEKHIVYNSANCSTWIQWAELERGLDDLDRARAIFEMGVNQPMLDMPEVLWKAYIDFEEEEGEYERTRDLYERLLEKANHPKVWISYAQFEINIPEADGDADADDGEATEEAEAAVGLEAKERARKIFERAHSSFRDKDLKAERVVILNAWLAFEKTHGTDDEAAKIQNTMPRRTKKKRRLEDGTWEEYVDYVFPADDKQAKSQMNLLAMAQAWKKTGGTVAAATGILRPTGRDEHSDDPSDDPSDEYSGASRS